MLPKCTGLDKRTVTSRQDRLSNVHFYEDYNLLLRGRRKRKVTRWKCGNLITL